MDELKRSTRSTGTRSSATERKRRATKNRPPNQRVNNRDPNTDSRTDVAKILDEAITNIDDVSMHDEKSPLLPKALRKLAASATQIIDQLTPLRSQAKSEEEISNMEQAVENAQSIIEAAKKLPPPAEKEKKDKTKGGTPKEKP